MADEVKLIGNCEYPQKVIDMLDEIKESIFQSLHSNVFDTAPVETVSFGTDTELFCAHVRSIQDFHRSLFNELALKILMKMHRERVWRRMQRRRRRRARGR